MKSYHRWFCIIWFYSETFPRTLRVISMSTNIVVILFIQALTYDLTNPDDGTCPTYESADECLAESSAFDSSVPKCTWTPKRYGGTCAFREPEDSLSIVIFVAIFSAMVSIPLLVSVEYLVKNVLSAKARHSQAALDGSMYENVREEVISGEDNKISQNSTKQKSGSKAGERQFEAVRGTSEAERSVVSASGMHSILSKYAAKRDLEKQRHYRLYFD